MEAATLTGRGSNVAPTRSLEQRRAALREANRIRLVRAQLKRDMKAGLKTLEDALSHEDTGTMKVMDVLLAMPKVGRVKANRVLVSHRISPSKTIGGMTERQRGELLQAFW